MRSSQYGAWMGERVAHSVGVLGNPGKTLGEYTGTASPGLGGGLHGRGCDDQVVKSDMGLKNFKGTGHVGSNLVA